MTIMYVVSYEWSRRDWPVYCIPLSLTDVPYSLRLLTYFAGIIMFVPGNGLHVNNILIYVASHLYLSIIIETYYGVGGAAIYK